MNLTNEKVKELKKDFPIFRNKVHGKPLVFLDNAASTQKPRQVIDAISDFYSSSYANIHRGVYPLSERATEKYELAHDAVGGFINAGKQEIIFTKGATESLNLLSYALPSIIPPGKDEIVLTEMEHHSNLVPWQQLAKRNKMKLKFISVKKDFTLDYADAEKKITDKAAIVSVSHTSNALGTVNDVKRLVRLGIKAGAFTIVDAAQGVPHQPVDVKSLGCDFLAFSAHKMLGPSGIGVLYGRKELLEKMEPFNFGGDMIRKVSYDDASWNELPMKFEAGTPHIAGAAGFAESVNYLNRIGMENISRWENELLKQALESIAGIKGIMLYSPGPKHSSGILSFNLNHVHAHDVASLLGDDGVCIRGGHHCAMPLMEKLGISGTSRASFYLYNTVEDINIFIESLKNIKKMFSR
ncbi:SufS family cysteine desulfurase [Candidatus Woesearchaeota archaeon]|nr:SufS family cysteine desulfurase [Candidatus Woesearchaeota archaeon]